MADDTPGVIEALRRLRNTRYHDRPVSLYGGMVELPLIVTSDDGARWFADRDFLTGGCLWAERDADLRADTERLAHVIPSSHGSAPLMPNDRAAGRAPLVASQND